MASPFRQASFQPIPGVAPHEWGVPVDVSARVFPITASDPIQERRVLSAAFHAGVQDRIASLRARREPHRYTVFPFSNIVIGRIIPPPKKGSRQEDPRPFFTFRALLQTLQHPAFSSWPDGWVDAGVAQGACLSASWAPICLDEFPHGASFVGSPSAMDVRLVRH